MEPIKHSIDHKTNSANIDNHDSNDIDTTSLDDRKSETETPVPLPKNLHAKNTMPERENQAIENFHTTSEEMVSSLLGCHMDGWIHGWIHAQLSEHFLKQL